jgi:hypothetical protein
LKEPFRGSTDQRGQLRRLTTLLHQRYLLGVSVTGKSLSLPLELRRELKVLKEIMGFFVFKQLVDTQKEQQKKITELFKYFVKKGKEDLKNFDPAIQTSLEDDQNQKLCSFEESLARAAAD